MTFSFSSIDTVVTETATGAQWIVTGYNANGSIQISDPARQGWIPVGNFTASASIPTFGLRAKVLLIPTGLIGWVVFWTINQVGNEAVVINPAGTRPVPPGPGNPGWLLPQTLRASA